MTKQGRLAAQRRERALTWLIAHVRDLRKRLKEAEAFLAKPDLPPERREQILKFQERATHHLRQARTEDPDLAVIRGTPEFAKLFLKRP